MSRYDFTRFAFDQPRDDLGQFAPLSWNEHRDAGGRVAHRATNAPHGHYHVRQTPSGRHAMLYAASPSDPDKAVQSFYESTAEAKAAAEQHHAAQYE